MTGIIPASDITCVIDKSGRKFCPTNVIFHKDGIIVRILLLQAAYSRQAERFSQLIFREAMTMRLVWLCTSLR